MPGFLAVLLAKLAGLGAATKVAAATTAAAVTMAVGAGTGVLRLPGDSADPALVAHGAVEQATAAVASAAAAVPLSIPATTAVRAATVVPSPAGSTSAKAGAVVPAPAAAPVKVPAVSNVAAPSIPALPAVPSCVANLVPTGGTVPDPTVLITQLPACIQSVIAAHLPLDTIQQVIGSAKLPISVTKCLTAVLGSVPGFVSGDVSGVSRLLAACLPTGSTPGMGSLPGMRFGR